MRNTIIISVWIHRVRIILGLMILLLGLVMLQRVRFEGPFALLGGSKYDRSVPSASSRHSNSGGETPAIVKYMHSIPWDILSNGTEPKSKRMGVITDLIADLTEFALMEPLVPVSESCSIPPPLAPIDCSAYPDGLTGEKRSSPVRIAHMIQFGFEVDVLEIHLREVYDVVDYFFILESTRAQYETVIKPLVWEKVRLQSRFRPFLDKIVHIVIDDIDSATKAGTKDDSNIWYLESLQERLRFEKFLTWNNKQGNPFTDDDMIGFGDADEVSDRNNIWHLKHCVPKGPAIDIGIWFPVGKLTNAFETDWPVPGHPYSLGDPTFHTFKSAMAIRARGWYPSRNRGKSGSFMLGGMHMTRHRFLPYMMLESITCSECGWGGDLSFIQKIQTIIASNNMDDIVRWWDEYHIGRAWMFAEDEFWMDSAEKNALMKIPWFLKCNPDRYPYWTDGHDTRLDVINFPK